MQHFVVMAVLDAGNQLEHKGSDGGGMQPTRSALSAVAGVDQALQVLIQVLKDQCQLVIPVDDIKQPYDVDVVQLFQQGDFSDRGGRYSFVFVGRPDLFQRHGAAVVILCFEHLTIRSFSYFFEVMEVLFSV
ncbi:MAG: uncharacterized protein KVP18_003387 [Porospora cf. gigantea A]|uniref:uncharacterized protein n=1 Tax=Porospora cf. gigantea A TaxID=2853593 RepID=UPI0035596B44|nr:MAG: hypothetical protein KVP18_003387 [Porospora cf. gigantea A]